MQFRQLSSVTYGNGVTEQYGYDPPRMQMTSHKAGTTSPYTNRMDLAYSYSASAGQMGVGTTVGNVGQFPAKPGGVRLRQARRGQAPPSQEGSGSAKPGGVRLDFVDI